MNLLKKVFRNKTSNQVEEKDVVMTEEIGKRVQIYIRMIDATECFVPTEALVLGPNRFQIEDPKNNYDPVYSPWDFKPGDIVSCKYQKLSDGLGHRSQHLVAKNLCE
ncbi:MAG: hypothetical protein J6T64_04090 [Bacteroidaceae bacterium]|nr:hypothetical protein [Bacteroidaceae bacterium]